MSGQGQHRAGFRPAACRCQPLGKHQPHAQGWGQGGASMAEAPRPPAHRGWAEPGQRLFHSPELSLCPTSCWPQQIRSSAPPSKTTKISMYRCVSVQKCTMYKLYRSQLSRSNHSYKSQCMGQHQARGAAGPSGAPQHRAGEGMDSCCFVGSLLVQVAVQVHRDHHGCKLEGKRRVRVPAVPPAWGHKPTAPSRSTHEEEEAGVQREEGSVATLGQMVAHGAAPAPKE